ncbi:MAG: sugar transferase [bacterium]|nr:sugar transferase [bacterium]
MKKLELTLAFIKLPLDYCLLVLAGFTVYSLRFTRLVTAIRPVLFDLPWVRYWPIVLAVALGWIVIFALAGLYSTNPNRRLATDLRRIVLACSTGFAGITIYVFFTLQKFDSRFLVLAGWIFAILYVCAGRIFIGLIKILCYRLGWGLRRVIIIGGDAIAKQIKAEFAVHPGLGYLVIGEYNSFDYKVVANILQTQADEIIFTDAKTNETQTISAIDFASSNHLVFKYSADLFSTISSNMTVSTVAGIPIIELGRTRLVGWGKIIKRAVDIVVSIFLFIVLSPMLLIIALIILIESGAPVIYKNERVGQRGEKFFTYKFRSLYQKYSTGSQFGDNPEAIKMEAELIKTQNVKSGPVYKIKDDPRVTSFGRFIRKWSLDELPQLWNVIRGDMSLVGPRPHQPREVEQYQKWHHAVLAIKPGMTGMAQISGRSNLNFDEEVRLDTFYIEHWSLYLDLIILVKTPFVVIRRKGAY